MIGIQVEDTASPALKQLPRAVSAALRSGVFAAAQEAVGEIRRVLMGMKSTGRRTGNLARSFKETFLRAPAGSVSAAALSDSEYADIQDRGAGHGGPPAIRPRTVKRLAVPIGAGRNLPVGKWPRHFPKGELHFIPREGKHPLLATVSSTRKVTPMFVLMSSVKIPPKRYLAKAKRRAMPQIEAILDRHVSAEVRRVWGV